MKNEKFIEYIIMALILFIGVSYAFYSQYDRLESLNSLAVGQIYDAKRKPKRLIYRFRLDGNTFEGNIQKLTVKFDSTKYYLVGYNKKNPEGNYLFRNYPVNRNYNIDSLNQCCHPSDIIEWYDYF